VNKFSLLFIYIFNCAFSFSQDEFDKYGVSGSEVYTDLKTAIGLEKKVYKLDLSYKKLDKKLYNKINKLTNVQALKLSGNEVLDYPKNFEDLNNLIYFASYNNKFSAFPGNLKPFQNLHYLELQHTKIDSIPAQIAYLGKLQTFKFGNTDDTLCLPNTLKFLKNLKDISFENCTLDSFPKVIFKLGTLNFLSLSNTNTHFVTKHFERFTNLEVLIIENNPISEIPFEIYKAQKLRFISLRGSQIRKIPDSISELQNLTLLDLRGNPLEVERIEELKVLLPGCEIKF
jgi:Leucine-rich repeat (LRR) protein